MKTRGPHPSGGYCRTGNAATPGTQPFFKCAEVAGNTIPQLQGHFKERPQKLKFNNTSIYINMSGPHRKYKKGWHYGGDYGKFHSHAKRIQARIRGMIARRKARERRLARRVQAYERRHPTIYAYMGARERQTTRPLNPLPYSNISVTAPRALPGHANMQIGPVNTHGTTSGGTLEPPTVTSSVRHVMQTQEDIVAGLERAARWAAGSGKSSKRNSWGL